MKKLCVFLLLVMITTPVFAELRLVAISCKATIKKGASGTSTITGYKFSLHTGLKTEEVKDVTLKELLPKIEKVAWPGSVVEVFIFSDYGLDTNTLISILQGIKKNKVMELTYLENGITNKSAERIKKYYKLK